MFTSTKQDANQLVQHERIKNAEVMHGDIAQNQREVTIERFKQGKFKVLIATDVASRGLDIKDVDLVIQIEPPKDTETYIHRSGRTARAGRSGVCITFFNKKNYEFLQRIEDLAGIRFNRVGVPQPEEVIKCTSRGVIKELMDVNEDILDLFDELAKDLIYHYEGNAEKALQVALAYCTGHHKEKLVTKSMITGQDKMTTVEMVASRGNLYQRDAQAILRKFWDPRTADNAKNMKESKDGTTVVFDLWSDKFDGFMHNFERLKATQSQKVDFTVKKCT